MLEVTSDTYSKEVLEASGPVVVDFWGPQCAPCISLMPQVEKLEGVYAGKVKMVKVDASKNRRLCLTLKVLGLPTYLFYRDGVETAKLSGGTVAIGDIEGEIKKLV